MKSITYDDTKFVLVALDLIEEAVEPFYKPEAVITALREALK